MLTFRANPVSYDSIEHYQIKPINNFSVKQKNNTDGLPLPYKLKIKEYPVTIAELNVYSAGDREAVNRLVRIWGEKGKDLPFLASMFKYAGESPNIINSRFFILTRQCFEQEDFCPYAFSKGTSLKDSGKTKPEQEQSPFLKHDDPYNKVDPRAILGIAQTTELEDGTRSIDILQVNPFHTYDNPYSDLRKVGSVMIENLKNIFANDKLVVFSPRKLIDFFTLRGFNIQKSSGNKDEILMTYKQEASKVKLIK